MDVFVARPASDARVGDLVWGLLFYTGCKCPAAPVIFGGLRRVARTAASRRGASACARCVQIQGG